MISSDYRRMDGLYLLLLGVMAFLLIGLALENAAPVSTPDFRVMYYSAQCFLRHCDPYNISELQNIYRIEGGVSSFDTPTIRLTEVQYIYAPTAFSITVPFAVFPFWVAHLLWLAVTALSFIIACILIWDIGGRQRPVLTGVLVCLALANSELFLVLGNPAGIAISCCVIAVWCFLQERFIPLGVVCFAVSLMLKPHDTGLVWCYFFLVGGANRKRSILVIAVALLLSLPSLFWITQIAPNWMQELSTNLIANSAPGGLSDPGPKSMAAHGIGMLVSLQAVFSEFNDRSEFYNSLSYLICGVLLSIWLLKTLRAHFSPQMACFALAPIAALSILPTYHRIYDARLLLLTVPACAMLWAESGMVGRIAALLTSVGIVLTGGIPWAIFLQILSRINFPKTALFEWIFRAIQAFPVPLTLLAISIFYLWVYWCQVPVPEEL